MHTLADLRAGRLVGIKRLDLSCGLTDFPAEIFTLADSLEVLNLTGNALTCLPHDLHRLHKLEVLFASDNLFTELPACLGQCQQLQIIGFKANRIERVAAQALPPRLRWLILTDNCIDALPDELGECGDLQKLMLAGNRLAALPASLARCQNLELVRIAANRFETLPAWLPALPALAWLAHADNPLHTQPVEQPIRAVSWEQLEPGECLGEGASGVILRARWLTETTGRDVAVKLYKGDVTSDGSPLNEMAACIAAGDHPQLIGVLGRIVGHPDDRQGLVMELIAPSFTNLAGPPSLASCTRDLYPTDMRLTTAVLLKMAQALASVVAHLHAHGITHGDLYGHNILWQASGECLLGDFGAASFSPVVGETSDDSGSVPALAIALQRVETRAFGILLGELLERCDAAPNDETLVDALARLQRRCVQPETARRPLMAEVSAELHAWSA